MAKRSEVGICTKYILFFENFILFLVGLALLAIGTYILVLKKKRVPDPLEFFLDPACDMCLAGALIFVLAFLGCTGALRENICFLKLGSDLRPRFPRLYRRPQGEYMLHQTGALREIILPQTREGFVLFVLFVYLFAFFLLVGTLIFVVAFFGCFGTLKESIYFLKLFYHVLSLLLLLELGAAICFFLIYYMKDVRDALFPKDTFNEAIVSYRDDRDMQDLIDSLQKSLGCCGLSDSETGYEDWNKNIYFNCNSSNSSPEKCSVPPSCCRMQAGQTVNLNCGAGIYTLFKNGKRIVSDTSKIYTDGCLKALGDWVNQNSLVLGGVLLGILLPQIFIICLSRNLIDMINAQKSKWTRQ
ncbi:hypothetical protein ACOMHN_019291 [Nucella lapillus]